MQLISQWQGVTIKLKWLNTVLPTTVKNMPKTVIPIDHRNVYKSTACQYTAPPRSSAPEIICTLCVNVKISVREKLRCPSFSVLWRTPFAWINNTFRCQSSKRQTVQASMFFSVIFPCNYVCIFSTFFHIFGDSGGNRKFFYGNKRFVWVIVLCFCCTILKAVIQLLYILEINSKFHF